MAFDFCLLEATGAIILGIIALIHCYLVHQV